MSAFTRDPTTPGYLGLRMDAEQFLAIGETQDHYQLIDGVVTMSPSPSTPHQDVVAEIIYQLRGAVERIPGVRVLPELDIRLSATRVYRPDVVCFVPGRLGPSSPIEIPPDLVVEVLSPSTMAFDLTKKREDFDAFGIAEYWCINPDPRSDGPRARVWVRSGGRLVSRPVDAIVLESSAIPGLALNLSRLPQ